MRREGAIEIVVSETTETSPRIADARHRGKCRVDVTVRKFPALAADEPPHHGGDDVGPTPLEYVTAGLAACQAVTVAKIADAMRLDYSDLAVHAETDVGFVASRRGGGPVPRFQAVRLVVGMRSGEAGPRLHRLKELVEERCPAGTLFRDAGLEPVVEWRIAPRSR